MRLNQARVAQFAKQADALARDGRRVSSPGVAPPPPEPEIEVSVEYLDEVPTALRRSGMMAAVRTVDGPDLGAVPLVVVSREDLAWFEFDADAHAILAMVDGESTVGDIVASVALAPERTLALLKDLELQRVIAV